VRPQGWQIRSHCFFEKGRKRREKEDLSLILIWDCGDLSILLALADLSFCLVYIIIHYSFFYWLWFKIFQWHYRGTYLLLYFASTGNFWYSCSWVSRVFFEFELKFCYGVLADAAIYKVNVLVCCFNGWLIWLFVGLSFML